MATSIVAPAPTVTVPINNAFLPEGTLMLLLISLSVNNIPSDKEILPTVCIDPSELAVPVMELVLTPTILEV